MPDIPVTVSIIMPAFNAERFISMAIESVVSQTFPDWELIVIDDGSTDTTKAIIGSFAEKDNRVKYLYQANKRQAAARNNGIGRARGTWIAFLDADDCWLPEKLAIQIKYTQVEKAGVFFSGGYIIDEYDQLSSDYPTLTGRIEGDQMYRTLYEWNPVPILSTLIRADLVKGSGPQDERDIVAGCEDLDFWIRLSAAGTSFYGIGEKLFKYRINPNGASRNSLQMQLATAVVLVHNFEKRYFSHEQVSQVFKPLSSFIPILISGGRFAETTMLLKGLSQKVPVRLFKFSQVLFSLFKAHAVLPIKVINKVESFINDMKKPGV